MNPLKNNKLSKEDNKKILANVKASLAVDGLIVTESETKILEDYMDELITEADVLKIINSKESVNKY
ncbi:hypothetical protein [Clostridium tagluense]|uniref:hypothetical protein n=1 Tax=Clostridium tagluense TaxID=360422 RepID=UPI001C0B31B0|nr:hypothetical protein [Clostridium tagluense]MBU3130684.1 hypothetical protein [Clostridium tagluense]